MKYAALITLSLFLVALTAVGFLFASATVEVTPLGITVTGADTQPALFGTLQDQVANGLVIGTPYTDQVPGNPEDYRFCTYSVRLKNNCFIAADMIELQITPMTGDVLQIADDSPRSLSARRAGDLSATILTTQDSANVREATLSYYFWGLPFTRRLTLGR